MQEANTFAANFDCQFARGHNRAGTTPPWPAEMCLSSASPLASQNTAVWPSSPFPPLHCGGMQFAVVVEAAVDYALPAHHKSRIGQNAGKGTPF